MGVRDSYSLGTFCWVDLVATDAAAATRFYAGLLGWEAADGEGYTHCSIGGRDVAAVYALDGVAPHWTSYVAVDDADATAARAAELGGTVVEPPFDVGAGGRSTSTSRTRTRRRGPPRQRALRSCCRRRRSASAASRCSATHRERRSACSRAARTPEAPRDCDRATRNSRTCPGPAARFS